MKSLKLHLFAIVCVLVSALSHAWAQNTITFGQVETGSITAAAQSNAYTFSANAKSVLDFTLVATSGTLVPKIQVYSSNGTLLGSNNSGFPYGCSGTTVELNTLLISAAGTYSVVVSDCSSTNTGAYLLYMQSTNNPVGAVNLPFGQPLTGTIDSAAQSSTYTFSANQNDVVDFTIDTTSGDLIPRIRLYNPDGSSNSSNNAGFPYGCSGTNVELNQVSLPQTGNYTVLVADCDDTNTGSFEIYSQRTDNPAGAAALHFGQVETGSITAETQSSTYTFTANANDVVDFTLETTSGALVPKIRLYNPNGTLNNSNNAGFPYGCSGTSVEMNTVTLPTAGTYTVLVGDCTDTNTGNFSIYSQRTNNPSGASNLPFAQVQTGLVASIAQSYTYTFNDPGSDVVDFTLVTTNGSLVPRIRLHNPDGSSNSSNNAGFPYGCSGTTVEMNTVTLTQSGTYTVLVADCSDINTGNFAIYAQSTVNPAGPVTVDWGQVQSGTISSTAQSNTYTFSGVANDGVDFTVVTTSGSLIPRIRLYNPDGSLNSSNNSGFPYGCSGTTVQLGSITLAQTGNYTLLVGDCSDTLTGTYNLSSQCFGTCTEPETTVSFSAPPTFPSEPVGTTSPAQTVTVTNTGSASLTFTAISVTGPFAIAASGTTCSTSSPVAPSGSCTVALTFTPTGVGTNSGTLSFADNAGNSPQTVSLTGTGATAVTAATPAFSPPPGTYTSPQTVTISDATAGATIYYTTNGTTPTTSSTQYTDAITVSSTETIEAIATASGYSTSAVATATYTITGTTLPPAATPSFSVPSGTYTSAQTVTISDATAGATIYYTMNGTTPTTSSTQYAGAIVVSYTETIEAIATASGYSTSAAATATYTISAQALGGPSVSSAYQELHQRVVANASNFYVYLDQDSGLNHGYPSGWFGTYTAITIDTGCIDNPADTVTGCYPSSNTTALDRPRGTVFRVTFAPLSATQFAGLNIEEPLNWGANGQPASNGYDLTGATAVSLDVRSPGGVSVQFGVNSCMTNFIQLPASTTYTTLTLTLDTNSLSCTPDLTGVHLLFTIVTNGSEAGAGGTVLIDNIRFTPVPPRTAQGSETLSLPLGTQTFGVVPQTQTPFPPDQANRNIASIYEAALSVLGFLARGTPQDLADAQSIVNALDYALHNDNQGDPLPVAPGGFAALHNAYSSGDIALLNGQSTGASAGNVRLSGFTCGSTSPTGFCLVLDGATGGNNAFAVLALVAAYRQFGNVTYLNDALEIANWIVGNLTDITGTGYGGYFVGYPDQGQIPKVLIKGKSIENNADIFAAFTALAAIENQLGNAQQAAQWTAAAKVAGDFVVQMFDSTSGHFFTGTVAVGSPPDPSAGNCQTPYMSKGNDVINTCDFLDSNTFTTLAMAGSAAYQSSIDWTRPISYVTNVYPQTISANGLTFQGVDIIPPPPAGIAWEFTGQLVETCQYVATLLATSTCGTLAQTDLSQIGQAQISAPFADGMGLVAATVNGENAPPNNLPPLDECLTTPFQCIPERVGLAATVWAILASQKLNVFSPFPVANVSPGSLTFTGQQVGTTSAAQTVTLSNTGSVSLVISSITTSGDFAESDNCASSVAAGSSCAINVTFTPTAAGTRTGALTITDNSNGATGSAQTVSLTGTGSAAVPVAGVSPTTLSFAALAVNSTSSAKAVTLSNTGNAALAVASITTSGNFAQTNNCSSSVAAGGSCTINVTFAPTAAGSLTGTLTTIDNSNNTTGSTQTVSLSGTGQDFSLAVASGTSSTVTVSPGQSASYTVAVGAMGGFNQLISFTCAGAPSAASCTVTPSSLTPSSSTTNVTVSVTTTAPSITALQTPPPHSPHWPAPKVLPLLAALLLGLRWTVRGWKRVRPKVRKVLVPLAVALLQALALAACGGGGGTPTNPGTPAGTYTLTVTGTVGSGSTALSHSVTLTLTVT
jgi:hypothetical protein